MEYERAKMCGIMPHWTLSTSPANAKRVCVGHSCLSIASSRWVQPTEPPDGSGRGPTIQLTSKRGAIEWQARLRGRPVHRRRLTGARLVERLLRLEDPAVDRVEGPGPLRVDVHPLLARVGV